MTTQEGKTGIELIAEERKRQIEVEAWTTKHDSGHKNGEMADAAVCYALGDTKIVFEPRMDYPNSIKLVNNYWPWGIGWWKPSPHDRVRELTKAGALIAAEIDRLLNQQNKEA